MASSGYWEATSKKGVFHYCTVSGGYVMIGTRAMSSDGGFQMQDVENCTFEKFGASSSVKSFIKTVRGWISALIHITELGRQVPSRNHKQGGQIIGKQEQDNPRSFEGISGKLY
jgi:hypothetical protein